MSRPTTQQRGITQRRNTPAYGDAIRKDGAQVGLQVNAPLNVRAPESSAAGLARVLNVVAEPAMPALQQRVLESGKRAAEEGLLDQNTGKVNEARLSKDKAYLIGVSRAKGAAEVASVQREWDEKVQADGLDQLTPEEYAATRDAWMAERLDHLADDPVLREFTLPGLQSFVQRDDARYGELLVKQQQESYLDNSGTLLSEAHKNGKLAEVVPQVYGDHYSVLGGTTSNETIVQQLGELSVASGDPSVLDVIPERARSIPRLGRLIEQYRRESESVRDNKLAEQKKADDRVNADAKAGAERDIMLSIMDGSGKGASILRQGVESGVIPADEARVWFNIIESSKREKADGTGGYGAVNYGNVADIESRILSRQASRKEIAEARAQGKLGSGEIADRETARLMQLHVEVERENRSLAYSTYDDQIDADFPVTDEAGRRVAEQVKKNVEVKSRYREAIKAGKQPHEAYAEATKVTPKGAPSANSDLTKLDLASLRSLRDAKRITSQQYEAELRRRHANGGK